MHQNGEEFHKINVPRLEINFIVCISTALQFLWEDELVLLSYVIFSLTQETYYLVWPGTESK